MTIYFKKSTDVGAPALTNTAGSMITLLDYLLVTTMGWTKTVLATNVAKYTQPGGSNGFSLQVKDTATASAQVCGFETLTATDTGTGQFPTLAQAANNLYIDKSASNTWKFISDGKIFYLFVKLTASATSVLVFGDFHTYKSADAFHTCIIANLTAANPQPLFGMLSTVTTNATSGHFIARSYTQTGSSMTCSKISDYLRGTVTQCGNGGSTYPNPVDGGLKLAPLWLCETASGTQDRGLMPGAWNVLHTRPLSEGDTFSVSTGALSGRDFEIIDFGSTIGQIAIETSDTWGGF
jgi:hypothetical protein